MVKKFLAGLMAAAISTSAAFAQEVRVYNWSDYIDEDLLTKFTEETGIKIVYDVFDSNDVLEAKLLAGKSGYDVVVPSGSFLQRQISIGIFQKLDKSQLPNLVNAWDTVTEQTEQFDPGNQYSVNYMWGTTGIGVNVGKVQEILGEDAPLDSAKLMFDPAYASKLAECGIYMLDASDEVIPTVLSMLGEDPNSQDPKVIAKTEEILMAARPYWKKFDSSEYISALANGEICVAMGWSGDVLQARDRADEADNGVEVTYNAFAEGSVMWFDQMAIPADAPNVAEAHAFINFMLDAQNMGQAVNYVWYASGNLAAQEFTDAEILEDPAIYPTEEALKTLFVTEPYNPKAQRAVTRLWTKVKTGS